MRTLAPARVPVAAPAGAAAAVLRRKCACEGSGHSCDDCGKKAPLRRKAAGPAESATAPPIVHDVLRSPGRSLDAATRAAMEARLSGDFSHVRIHEDARAAESARAVRAEAYTVGRDVVFGAGRYAPGTEAGRRLLAHELAHVAQTGRAAPVAGPISIGDPADASERAADAAEARFAAGAGVRAAAVSAPAALRRKLMVNDPSGAQKGWPKGATRGKVALDIVNELCPGFELKKDEIKPKSATCPVPKASKRPIACGCLCGITTGKNDWTLFIDDNLWPHTDGDARKIVLQSPHSGVEFGEWSGGKSPSRFKIDNWRILGHELCGHGRDFDKDPKADRYARAEEVKDGGRPFHDETFKVENEIAKEHDPSAPMRGLFAENAHHGEGFARLTIESFDFGSTKLPAGAAPKIGIVVDKINEGDAASVPVRVEVIGHGDKDTASPAGNTATSKARADEVKKEIKAFKGSKAKESHFERTVGLGDAECASAGRDPACRKVEVFIFRRKGARLKP